MLYIKNEAVEEALNSEDLLADETVTENVTLFDIKEEMRDIEMESALFLTDSMCELHKDIADVTSSVFEK